MNYKLFMFLIFYVGTGFAQLDTDFKKRGIPFVQNFKPKEIGLVGPLFNKIFQLRDGQMAFCTSNGICFFDGIQWNYVAEREYNDIIDFNESEQQIIYFITKNDLGYYNTDKPWPYFVSIKNKIPKKFHTSLHFIKCFSLKNQIFFISKHHIFVLQNEKIRVIKSKNAITDAFLSEKTIYLSLAKGDLAFLNDHNITILPDRLRKEDNKIIGVFEKEDGLWICTNSGSFFRFIKNKWEHQFAMDEELYDKNASNNSVAELLDGSFVLSSNNLGIINVDTSGDYKQLVPKSKEIIHNNVQSMSIDREGGLWVSNLKGISRITLDDTSYFPDLTSITGRVFEVFNYQGQLYFGTESGLYGIDKEADGYKYVRKFNLNMPIYDSFVDKEFALIATAKGIFVLTNGHCQRISPEFKYKNITRSDIDLNRFYLGTQNKLAICNRYNENETWKWDYKSYSILKDEFVNTIYESAKGYLWFNTNKRGFFRWVPLVNTKDSVALDIKTLDSIIIPHGGTTFKSSLINPIKKKVLFTGDTVPYTLSDDEKELVPFPLSNLIYNYSNYNNTYMPGKIFEDSNDNLFINYLDMPIQLLRYQRSEQHKLFSNPVKIVPWMKYPEVKEFFEDQNNTIWFSTRSDLVRFDTTKPTIKEKAFKTLISEVSVQNDSTITTFLNKNSNISLPSEINTLTFKAGAPSFINVKNNKFKFFLKGYDKKWPDYFDYQNSKTYHNLSPGMYTLQVVSRNSALNEGEIAKFSFIIRPPWYQAWWAYLMYVLFLGLFIWGVVIWRTRRIAKKNEELEVTILQRTEELAVKNQKLENLDQAKSRFFANISHEFRTPLTLILGPLEQRIQTNSFNTDDLVMYRNGKRLQELINELLDLSKIESGELSLKIQKGNLNTFLQTVCSSFFSLAEHKSIDFKIALEPLYEETWFDKDKLEKIINNLISNAFKNTAPGESIIVKSILLHTKPGYWQLTIEDTGIGIAADKLPLVFERFYQIDTSDTREQEGTGIGLALVKELVIIYGGQVEVTSEPQKGTLFAITLPITPSLFDPKSIVESEVTIAKTPITVDLQETKDHKKKLPELEKTNTVLIVEDHTDLRDYVKSTISENYQILETDNGKEGVEHAFIHIPDLIITDIMMPKMNGEQLCKILKSDSKTSHIPIIMLTARADYDSKLKGLQLGADAYIFKPFKTEELTIQIQNLLNNREKLKKYYQQHFIINPSNVKAKSQDEKFLVKLSSCVEDQLDNPDLSVEILTNHINLSRTQLHRKLKALTGQSATAFIRTIRIKRAAQLLLQNNDTVSQIAYKVGFSDTSYFSKCFKKQYGVKPSDYSEQQEIL